MFVRKARNREEQNLVAYPHDGKIYFCTSRDIPPEHELCFYYSRDYARQLGVPEHPDVHICHCGKECASYADFKAHLSSHIHSHLPSQGHSSSHGPGHGKERKWKCSMCPQAFISPSKLHVHFMGHMGMKPHKCDFCSKAFSDPSNLRTHLKIHTGQKNYRCTLCDKSFTQKAHLESHMVIHTGEKNLKCDYCEKLFMRRQDLKQHVLTHTQERQIKCPKCDKLFLRTNHLKKHLNSHEGKRDYICEKCTKAYLTKYHLTRHLKICKGPTSSLSTPEEEEEDSEEELIDSMRTEDCRINNGIYSTGDALAGHKWRNWRGKFLWILKRGEGKNYRTLPCFPSQQQHYVRWGVFLSFWSPHYHHLLNSVAKTLNENGALKSEQLLEKKYEEQRFFTHAVHTQITHPVLGYVTHLALSFEGRATTQRCSWVMAMTCKPSCP